jgi:hypothetical protein
LDPGYKKKIENPYIKKYREKMIEKMKEDEKKKNARIGELDAKKLKYNQHRVDWVKQYI